jgi:phage shock protein PspC (stress-responsive transcriptional regulator)
VVSGLAKRFQRPAAYISVFFEPVVLIMLLGSAFALFVSLFLLIRPSRFHKFEHGANEWISLRRTIKPLEVMRNSVDAFTFRYPQQVGGTLVLGSIYTLALFTFWA